jgi:ribosomal protein S18 acetylase RimI-like enzyme
MFLVRPGHHVLLAFDGDVPVGFVSGVELTHPDKGTEMFLYELAVDAGFRRRGIGTALVAALRELAAGLRCRAMWVLTDSDNEAAMRTYRAAGANGQTTSVMLEWDLSTRWGRDI